MSRYSTLLALTLTLTFALLLQTSAQPLTFTNPVVTTGADPWVTFDPASSLYYYSYVGKDNDINVAATASLPCLQYAKDHNASTVWSAGKPDGSAMVWAPELHNINGVWYIYATMALTPGDNNSHRMHVWQCANCSSPLEKFELVGQLVTSADDWSIDGTVMQYNDNLYMIWSGWPGNSNGVQNLYIQAMLSPTQMDSSVQRMLISTPEYEWENKTGTGADVHVNEGPEVLTNALTGQFYIIYSASGSWTNDYCLGQLTLQPGADPMIAENWIKHPLPVFHSSEVVFQTGHASFTTSPDGSQHWVVFHSEKYKGSGWNREVHTQQFTFNSTNPVFPTALKDGTPIDWPAASPPSCDDSFTFSTAIA